MHHPDHDLINWWYTSLLTIVNPNQSRPKHLLVFINPYGGHGRAKQIWESKIAGILKTAGVGCKVIVTETSDHAHNVIQTAPLHNYDGIISVGGDGMFSQVIIRHFIAILSFLNFSSVDFQWPVGPHCPGQQVRHQRQDGDHGEARHQGGADPRRQHGLRGALSAREQRPGHCRAAHRPR